MARKRNPYFEQEKRYRRMVHEMVPKIYACFALSLHEHYGFGQKRIMRILGDTQRKWIEQANGNYDISAECLEKTGLNMISETTAKERGIKGDAEI